jgi:hypothetical protein
MRHPVSARGVAERDLRAAKSRREQESRVASKALCVGEQR